MADQPPSTSTEEGVQADRVVYKVARRERSVTREEKELPVGHPNSGEDDEVIVFESLHGIRLRSGTQDADVAGPSSAGVVPSGAVRSSDTALSERTSSSDNFLPYNSALVSIGKWCDEWRKCIWLVVVLASVVAVAILAALVYTFIHSRPASVTPSSSPLWLPWRNRTEDNGFPRLLLWNTGKRRQPLSQGVSARGDQSLFNITVCRVKGSIDTKVCEVTDNRHRLIKSDAIVFYEDHLDWADLPAMRAASQLWVFWARSHLPPPEDYIYAFRPDHSLPYMRHIFNRTMSKRADADIVLPHKTFRCPTSSDEPQAKPLDRRDKTVPLPPKGDIAWMFAGCEQYVFNHPEVIPHRGTGKSARDDGAIRIGMFPDCGAALCGSRAECVRYIAERYHFILITLRPHCFQNVHELIYEAFEYDLVPVVLMSSRETLEVPKNSVITSAKLQHEGELANYLRTVLNKPDIYRSYFAWKQRCLVIPAGADICALCHAMWENPMRRWRNPDVLEWWTRPRNCFLQVYYGLESGFVVER